MDLILDKSKKLHLGCGERYLNGYLNIDFSSEHHTVQKKTVADLTTNILELKIQPDQAEEVRLHHVFEHFDRPTAFALLFIWNHWLKKGGRIHIEVPDLFWTGLLMLFGWSQKTRNVATRHIFGSHEAHWAIHCEGWTASSLKRALKAAGFRTESVRRNYWRGTANLEVIAEKQSPAQKEPLFQLLETYLLDNEKTERDIFESWKSQFEARLERSI